MTIIMDKILKTEFRGGANNEIIFFSEMRVQLRKEIKILVRLKSDLGKQIINNMTQGGEKPADNKETNIFTKYNLKIKNTFLRSRKIAFNK